MKGSKMDENEQGQTQPAAGGVEDVQLPPFRALEDAETQGEQQPPGPDGQPAQTQADLDAAREAEQQQLAGDVEDDDLADDAPDRSAGVHDADVTAPNPYAGPLGYTAKFAAGKVVTDDQAELADDQLTAGAGDQLDQPPADQLDQQPPA
jgi:hypothetical protein